MACDIFVFSGCIFIETAHAGYLYVSALWFSLSLETRCTVLSRPIFNLSKSVFYENIWIYVINIRPSSFLQSGYGKHLFKCIIITMFCIDHTWWKNVPTVYRFTYIQPNKHFENIYFAKIILFSQVHSYYL